MILSNKRSIVDVEKVYDDLINQHLKNVKLNWKYIRRMAKKLKTLLKGYFNITIIFLTLFQACARFIGPTLFTLIVKQNNNSECDLDNDNYNTEGCRLSDFDISAIICNTVSCFLMLVGYRYLVRNINDKIDPNLTLPLNQVTQNTEGNVEDNAEGNKPKYNGYNEV